MPRSRCPSLTRGDRIRVFLTGGTGMIGSHVAERLRGRGDEVIAMVRSSSDTRYLRSLGCELVTGDLRDPPETTAEAMRRADAVVHAAARVFQSGSRSDYLEANVEGTRRILGAAALAAPRVVHLSSVAVYAGLSMQRPMREDRWTEAEPARQSAYAASKHLSERVAWRFHEAGDVRLTTVRPSVVYGERDRSATPIIVRAASLPLVPLIGGGRTTVPVVYAGNVAAGVVAALDRDASVGRAYNLALDVPVTLRALLTLAGLGLQRRPRFVPVHAGAAAAGAAVVGAVSRWLPAMGAGDLRRAVRSLSVDNPYDSSRARLELGWAMLVPHYEGMRRTMEWWRRSTGSAEGAG